MFLGTRRQQNFFEVSRISNFVAVGNSICLAVTNSSAATQFPTLPAQSPASDVMISNTGLVNAFITFDNSSPSAAVPTAGVPANGICIPAGAIMVLDKSFATYVAAITASGATTLYLSQGMGS